MTHQCYISVPFRKGDRVIVCGYSVEYLNRAATVTRVDGSYVFAIVEGYKHETEFLSNELKHSKFMRFMNELSIKNV